MTILELPSKVFRKVIGSRNDRLLKRYGVIADEALTFEAKIRALSPEELRAKTDEFKQRLAEVEPVDSVLPASV